MQDTYNSTCSTAHENCVLPLSRLPEGGSLTRQFKQLVSNRGWTEVLHKGPEEDRMFVFTLYVCKNDKKQSLKIWIWCKGRAVIQPADLFHQKHVRHMNEDENALCVNMPSALLFQPDSFPETQCTYPCLNEKPVLHVGFLSTSVYINSILEKWLMIFFFFYLFQVPHHFPLTHFLFFCDQNANITALT